MNFAKTFLPYTIVVILLVYISQTSWLNSVLNAEQPAANISQNSASTSKENTAYAKAEIRFVTHVFAILKTKCFACHGEDKNKIKGELNMLTREGLLKGGETEGPALIPGNADKSPMFIAVTWKDDLLEMPPKENDRLTPEQITELKNWINAGAPWPSDEKRKELVKASYQVQENEDGILIRTSGGTSEIWTYRRYKKADVWAYLPVTNPNVPKYEKIKHPIDAFILDGLQTLKTKPALKADRRTLIRRATYDLTGLPPTIDEINSFLSDQSDNAWEKVIDRLLASPHYGERWGQHWLDVVRYADTSGYSNDYERSNVWRYRDYVIRSFNQDKPYNQFMMEQVAGDEIRPKDPEMKIAVGMLRMGPWGTAMVPQPQARQAFLDDVVHGVGQTFLSTAMRCAKCHDHKFDPIPTRDYYRLYAAFATTQPAEVNAAFLDSENKIGFEENKKQVDDLLVYAEKDRVRLMNKQETAAKAWYKERNKPYLPPEIRKDLSDDQKPPRHVGLDYIDEGTLKVREQDVRIWTRRQERFLPMAQSVFNGPIYWYNGGKLRIPQKPNTKWKPYNTILTGGALEAKGELVTPGVLSCTPAQIENAPQDDPYKLPDSLSGRRLKLAKWLANDRNSLTTRSIVNRVWQYHFGRGIVATANNFGVKGAKPTHPELLDWLTHNFVNHGWRIKRLHKLIMTSHTYQQSIEHQDIKRLRNIDPNNLKLAYFMPRRLTAEELRDSMLAVTGELNREVGGLPIHPEINMEVALQPRMIQFSIAPAFQPSRTPQMRNRRSIYAYRVRGQADPFLEVFNRPNPNESCEARETASVSPQALTLLNSEVTSDRSIAFSRYLIQQTDDLTQQLNIGFNLIYGRDITPNELSNLTRYVTEMKQYHKNHKPEVKVYPTFITRSLVEEFSGKPFEYTEWLRGFEGYQPDLKANDVDINTRALADACLLLLNSNEFVYIY